MNERRINNKSSIIQIDEKETIYDYYLTQKNKIITEENIDKTVNVYFCKFCELNCKPYLKNDDT